MLSIRVLGPVEVTAGDARVDLGGSLPRRLFAALVAAGGQVVTDDRLADLAWDGQPPAKMTAALQVHISRLRGALGQGARELLERDSVGYRLRLDPDTVDATWFANAIDAGRRQLTEGNPDQAIRTFTEALALWRGDPYADIAEWDEVSAARSRLVELREVALEESAAARLAGGDAAGATADLEELTRAMPLRERRWALLILALYRAGRQGDALAALRRVRAVLADELGVDPGAELQDLERRVLAHDPNLDTPPQAASVSKPLTSFLGREREMQALTTALAEHRLVSLIGPAGVGKTRLAVEHASAGWFARLADVTQAAELPSVVADAVGLMAVKDPRAAVIRAIGDMPGLLVLDNCEHVVDAAAEFVIELVAQCPRLRILTTSREPLGVDGEVTIPVEPLPPETADALLVDRVRAIRPGWTPSADELAQARRISAALDGLPLAIELAAARARVFGLEEIAARLDDRFALLGQVARGSLTPHATLEAAISWSVDLLAPADRALLLRLWPFEGGFTLEAAEAVQPGHQTLESLSALVIRSVVVADTTVLPTRYMMLESVRAYCRSIDPDPRATRAAHAQWVRGMADDCVSAMRSRRAGRYLNVLRRELPNIRAALAHDLANYPLAAVRSVGRLSLFFTRCMHNTEALRWARAAYEASAGAPALDRSRVLVNLIALLDFQGDFDEARRVVSEAAAGAFAELDPSADPLATAEMCYFLAFAAVETRHIGIALEQAERAIAIGTENGIRWVAGAGRITRDVALCLQAYLDGDLDTMVTHAQQAQRIARGWTGGWANAVLAEAYLLHPDGPAADALIAARQAVAVFTDQEDIPFALNAMSLGALALYKLGRTADALDVMQGIRAHADRLGFLQATFLSPDAEWIDELLS